MLFSSACGVSSAVERLLYTQRVTGSNPVPRTTRKALLCHSEPATTVVAAQLSLSSVSGRKPRYSVAVKLSETLDPNQVRTAPFERDEPAKEWRSARRDGLLPLSVLDFYESTNFLSASRLAGFDTEPKRVVTVYINRVFGSLKECLEEADEQRRDLRNHIDRTYNPLRAQRNPEGEEIAARKARGAFRLFLIDTFGAFDAVAELVALLLPGEIKSLQVGRMMFTQIHDWAAKPLLSPPLIVSPGYPHLEKLHGYIRQQVVEDSVGAAWFDLLRLYRNKVTHLGHQTWPWFGLQGKDDNIYYFYYFLPRSWPFIAERPFQLGPGESKPTQTLREHLNESLVHVDITELVDQTYHRGVVLIDGCIRVLFDTYRALGIRQVDELALELSKRHVTAFTSFEPAG